MPLIDVLDSSKDSSKDIDILGIIRVATSFIAECICTYTSWACAHACVCVHVLSLNCRRTSYDRYCKVFCCILHRHILHVLSLNWCCTADTVGGANTPQFTKQNGRARNLARGPRRTKCPQITTRTCISTLSPTSDGPVEGALAAHANTTRVHVCVNH